MDHDLILTVGLAFAVLAFPALLSGWAEGRLPRLGLALLALSAGLLTFAVLRHPTGYALQDLPYVVLRVLARFWT